MRLDEKPEAPRCYHNCEVCVLRNGKGSREGIEIPKERPARYAEERRRNSLSRIMQTCRDRRSRRRPPPQPPPQRRQGQRASCGASGGKAGGKKPGGKSRRRSGGRAIAAAVPAAASPAPAPSSPFPPQPDAKPVSRQESQRPIEDEGPSNKRPPAPWRPPQRRSGRRYAQDGGVSRGKVFRRSDRQRL